MWIFEAVVVADNVGLMEINDYAEQLDSDLAKLPKPHQTNETELDVGVCRSTLVHSGYCKRFFKLCEGNPMKPSVSTRTVFIGRIQGGYIMVSLQRTLEPKDLRVYERKIACCVPPNLNALGHRKPILLMGEIGLTS